MNCVAPGFIDLLTLLSLHLFLAFLPTLHLCGPVSLQSFFEWGLGEEGEV